VRTGERLESVLANEGGAVLDVLVELGGLGGRTGARTVEEALAVARAAAAAPHVRVVGVSGYEGALAHTADDAGLAAVRGYLTALRDLHEALLAEGLYGADEVIVTAGGSAYFDDVVEILSPCIRTGEDAAPRVDGLSATIEGAGERSAARVDVILRSGAYLIHDDGFYRGISPLSRASGATPLRSAMHGWARVVSHPEPELALLDAGKRDLPFDEGLPEPQLVRGTGPLTGATVTALNDQHAFLRGAGPAAPVGAVLRLGLSHPCTAFDKWSLIPVLDHADTDHPRVVDLVRTYF
jgi:D-serine deaminase-like pyridoxal phosphate-dependent protein